MKGKKIKNNVKIVSEDEIVKVFLDGKEITGIQDLKLSISRKELRTLDIKLIVNNLDIEVEANKLELPRGSSKKC